MLNSTNMYQNVDDQDCTHTKNSCNNHLCSCNNNCRDHLCDSHSHGTTSFSMESPLSPCSPGGTADSDGDVYSSYGQWQSPLSPQRGLQSPQWEFQSAQKHWQGAPGCEWDVHSPQWDVSSPQEDSSCQSWQWGSTPQDEAVSPLWGGSSSPGAEGQPLHWQEEVFTPEGDAYAGLLVTRQQIGEHNRKVGWQQWITFKGSVYHTTGFRDHFIAYNKKKAAEAEQEGSPEPSEQHGALTGDQQVPDIEQPWCGTPHTASVTTDDQASDEADLEHKEAVDSDNSSMSDSDDSDDCGDHGYFDQQVGKEKVSLNLDKLLKQYNVLTALHKSGLSMSEIETEIKPFKIGTLRDPAYPRWKYWESIRSDIIGLHDDISSKQADEVSRYEKEYLDILQRWLRKYQDMDPTETHKGGDGNSSVFFITQDPDSFRKWTRTLPPLDTQLPESGAWVRAELQLSPLGDTHDVFTAALRSHHSDDQLLSHDIQGNVAWTELPQDVISRDQMTDGQQAVHEARKRMGERAQDPACMKRKRQRLGCYFQKKYGYSREMMNEFLKWSVRMEENQRQFIALCSSDAIA